MSLRKRPLDRGSSRDWRSLRKIRHFASVSTRTSWLLSRCHPLDSICPGCSTHSIARYIYIYIYESFRLHFSTAEKYISRRTTIRVIKSWEAICRWNICRVRKTMSRVSWPFRVKQDGANSLSGEKTSSANKLRYFFVTVNYTRVLTLNRPFKNKAALIDRKSLVIGLNDIVLTYYTIQYFSCWSLTFAKYDTSENHFSSSLSTRTWSVSDRKVHTRERERFT